MAKRKFTGTADLITRLAEQTAVWDRAVLGTVAPESLNKPLHALSASCHGKLGVAEHPEWSWGEMLLCVLAAARRDGHTIQRVLEDAAKLAELYQADSDAVLARQAADAERAELEAQQ